VLGDSLGIWCPGKASLPTTVESQRCWGIDLSTDGILTVETASPSTTYCADLYVLMVPSERVEDNNWMIQSISLQQ
jgi:hypothetical protein